MSLSRLISILLGAAVLVSFALPARADQVAADEGISKEDAAAKLVGTYVAELDDEAKKKLDELRKKAAEAPESEKEMAMMMLKMMEAMAGLTMTFTKTDFTTAIGDQSKKIGYTVTSSTADSVKITTKEEGEKEEGEKEDAQFTIQITATGLELIKDGNADVLKLQRK